MWGPGVIIKFGYGSALFSLATVCLLASGVKVQAAPPRPVLPAPVFTRDILPVLRERCTVCHNHESLGNTAVSGGLDLETHDGIVRGVVEKGGARSIITGGSKPGGSLMERLESVSPTRLMPRGGPPLSPAQIALFRRWVAAGAPAGLSPASAVRTVSTDFPMPAPAPASGQMLVFKTSLHLDASLQPAGKPDTAPMRLALPLGPVSPVTALAFSPDGQTLAVGSYRAVTLWSTATAQPIRSLSHLRGPVQTLAFKPDGSQLAIGGGLAGSPGELRVLNAKTLAPEGPALNGHLETVLSVAWSPDGTQIASGSQDRTARLWQWPSGKELFVLKEHGDTVNRVCFAPDGKALYTASTDHNLRRYDLPACTLLRTYSGHNEAVSAMAVSADGKKLVSAGIEPALKWWNADTGDVIANAGGHSAAVNEMAISKDGKTLITASADNTARVWDAIGTGQQRALEGSADWLFAVAISPDGKLTAGAGVDGIVRLWETAIGKLRVMLFAWPPDKGDMPEWAAVTPDGYYAASAAWANAFKTMPAAAPASSAAVQAWLKGTLLSAENVSKLAAGTAVAAPKLPTVQK
jgi:WD40 repeat protein